MLTADAYQVEAGKWLLERGRAMLADETGVGKSGSALSGACFVSGSKLIVVPRYLFANWRYYLEAFLGLVEDEDFACLSGTPTQKKQTLSAPPEWLVVSYGSLAARRPGCERTDCRRRRCPSREKKCKGFDCLPSCPVLECTRPRTCMYDKRVERYPELVHGNWQIVIFDESQRMRNFRSQRSKTALTLCRDVPYVWLLTATPMVRNGGDMFMQLQLCDPDSFRSYWRFVERWCDVVQDYWAGRKVGRIKNVEAFQRLISHYVLRRSPEDVGLEMLPLTEDIIRVDLTPTLQQTHDTLKKEFLFSHPDLSQPKTLSALGALIPALREVTGFPPGKQNPKLRAVEGVLENHEGEPVIIFTWHREARRRIAQDIKLPKDRPLFEVKSSAPQKQRDVTVSEWEGTEDGVLLSTISIMSEGYNLQHARVEILYEYDWVYATQEQAYGRIRRRGQTRPCIVYPIICRKTVDEAVWKAQRSRKLDVMRVLAAHLFSHSH